MARPTLWNHRKFRDLTMALRSEALAIGTLECLWRGPYDSGDPLIGSSEAVEHAARWTGKRGALTPILESIGFIDLTPRGYEIHDLMDHAPQYVKLRHQREQKRRQRSITDQSLINRRSIIDSHSRSEHCALSTEPLPTTRVHTASGEGSQATSSEQPNSEQPPPDAKEFFAAITGTIRRPGDNGDAIDLDERRRELELQKHAILSAAGGVP